MVVGIVVNWRKSLVKMSYTKVVYDGWMVRYGTRKIGWLILHMRFRSRHWLLMGIVEWRIEVSKRNMDMHNKNEIEIVVDKVSYYKVSKVASSIRGVPNSKLILGQRKKTSLSNCVRDPSGDELELSPGGSFTKRDSQNPLLKILKIWSAPTSKRKVRHKNVV
ncbi:hypothetical protein Tco_1476994 [Tanacetum coccineum]